MVDIKKEKLIEEIYDWIMRDVEAGIEKERLLKVMIEATLDYLYDKEYLDVEKRQNGQSG